MGGSPANSLGGYSSGKSGVDKALVGEEDEVSSLISAVQFADVTLPEPFCSLSQQEQAPCQASCLTRRGSNDPDLRVPFGDLTTISSLQIVRPLNVFNLPFVTRVRTTLKFVDAIG